MHSLSIVIPAFNEDQRLPATLKTLCEYLQQRDFERTEILVIDDGSRDRTAELATEWSVRHPFIRLLRNPGNRGKGYAVRAGLQAATGDWVLVTDADLSTPIEDLTLLEAAIAATGAAGAIGSRAIDRRLTGVRQHFVREFSGRFFNLVMRLITGLHYCDTQCGFKLFRRDAAAELAARQTIDGFGFDVELLYIARRLGYAIDEIAVHWNNAEGTKVSLWSGLKAFADPVRVRWNDLRGRYR